MTGAITDYTLMASLINVERWGTIPRLRRTTVASHTFDVSWTLDWLIDTVIAPGAVSDSDWRRVIRWALRHDQLEGLTGDIPSPPKRLDMIHEDMERFTRAYPRVGELGAPDDRSRLLIKSADRMCMMRDAATEERMGNSIFRPVAEKCLQMALDATSAMLIEWPGRGGMTAEQVVARYMRECPPGIGISIIVERDLDGS